MKKITIMLAIAVARVSAVIPTISNCDSDQTKLLDCLSKTPDSCTGDCFWCTDPVVAPPGVIAALAQLDSCTVWSGECTCTPPPTPTATPTATPSGTTAPEGYCVPSPGTLSESCSWTSSADGVRCDSLDFGTGGCATVSGGDPDKPGPLSLPECSLGEDSVPDCMRGTSVDAAGVVSCSSPRCQPCGFEIAGETRTVCLPTEGKSCRETGLGSLHIAYDGSGTCPELKGVSGELTGSCKEELFEFLTVNERPECVDVDSHFEEINQEVNGDDAVSKFVEEMCTNSCLWSMQRQTMSLASSCSADDLANEDGLNSAALVGKTLNMMCTKNEDGKFCAEVLGEIGSDLRRRRARRVLRGSSLLGGHDVHVPVTGALSFVERIARQMATNLRAKLSSEKLQVLQSGGVPEIDCSELDAVKPQFEEMRKVAGCCIGEIFGLLVDPEVVGSGEESALLIVIFETMKECGLDFISVRCSVSETDAAKLKGTMKIAIKNYNSNDKEKLKDAVRDDLATNLAISVERVIITKFDSSSRRGAAHGATRILATADIQVDYTILGDITHSSGLEKLQSDIEGKDFKMTNTDIAAGGDGSGSAADVSEAPTVSEIEKAPSETSGSASRPAAAPLALAMVTFVALFVY